MCIAWFFYEQKTGRSDVVPLPAHPLKRKAVVEQLSPNLGGVIYELGSGWGGLAADVAKNCPKASVVGVEVSWLPYIYSRLLVHWRNLRFQRANFFSLNLENATALVCYLNLQAMADIKAKLFSCLPKDCLVVSCTFPFPDMEPLVAKQYAGNSMSGDFWVYVYRF